MSTDNATDEDFAKGRWPLADDYPLSDENYAEYVAKFGEERALGYLDAVRDFQKHFQRCFQGYTTEYGAHIQPVGATSMVKKLFHRNIDLLKLVADKQQVDNPPKP